MTTAKKAFRSRADKRIFTETLVEQLTELLLKNNIFENDGNFSKQKQRTVIGTKMALPYAILFMDELERKILERSSLKPHVWGRYYIDDTFLILKHTWESLMQFLDYMNSCHPTIRFILLTSNKKHYDVFENIPLVGF